LNLLELAKIELTTIEFFSGKIYYLYNDTSISEIENAVYTIQGDDPLTAKATIDHEIEMEFREEFDIIVYTDLSQTSLFTRCDKVVPGLGATNLLLLLLLLLLLPVSEFWSFYTFSILTFFCQFF
jgi:hypothetical protein